MDAKRESISYGKTGFKIMISSSTPKEQLKSKKLIAKNPNFKINHTNSDSASLKKRLK